MIEYFNNKQYKNRIKYNHKDKGQNHKYQIKLKIYKKHSKGKMNYYSKFLMQTANLFQINKNLVKILN